jgi:transposase
MRRPVFVRPLTDEERQRLAAGLRSSDAFVLRPPQADQILLASARGEWAPRIALSLGCDDQTVRNAIADFNESGLASLVKGSSAPHKTRRVLDSDAAERLKALLHQSPRLFGRASSLWTLELAAEVSFQQGITPYRVSDETIRAALKRLEVGWKRAKTWITSPDPEYARKKSSYSLSSSNGRDGNSRLDLVGVVGVATDQEVVDHLE